ncbi:6-bladed beta-propeller [Thiolapillus sp.]
MARLLPRLFRATLFLVAGTLLASCAGSPYSALQEDEEQNIVWPQPPGKARIRFVNEISNAADLGIQPGLWSRLAGWIAGGQGQRLIRPTAAVMTPEEVLYVADPGSRAVHRFDIRRNKYEIIRLKDGSPFRSPVALAIGPENRIYVSDSALNQIFLITGDKKQYAIPFQTSIALDQPTGLAVDNERLYVVNTLRHEILAFDLEGQLLFRFGRRGAGTGEFNFPTMIWSEPSSRRLWITDSLNFRIQQFDQNGRFISTFGRPGDATGDLPRPKGVATDRHGNLYVLDSLHNSMQIFNPAGELLLYIGEQGQGPGQFWLPTGIFIDSKNRIFVADSFNSRVQIFRYLVEER